MPAGLPQLQELLVMLIQISVRLAFVALLLMIVYGAIRYMLSGGGKDVEAAHKIIGNAVMGILFLAGAWLALLLVQAFTGITLTTFCLGFAPYCIR